MADYSPIYNRKIYNTDANSDLYLKTFVTTEDNTKSKSAYYTIVLEDKDKTKSLAYSVFIGKYLTCAYSLLLTGSDKDLTAAYSVNLDNNTKSKSLAFSVVMLKEPDYTSSYEVLASNTESRTSSYEVLVEDNTANKTLGYDVMTPDSYKQKTITYNVKPLYDIDKSVYYGVLLNKDKDVTSTFDLSYMYDADYSSYYSVKDTLSVSKVCSFSTLSEVGIYTVFSEIQHPVVTGDSSVFVEDTSLFEVSDYVYLIDTAGTYQLVGLTAVNDYNLVFSPVASIDITDGIVLLNEPTLITGDTDITNYVFSRKTNPNLYVGVSINEAGFIDVTPQFSGYTALTNLNVEMDSTLQLFKLRIDDGGQVLPYNKELDLEIRLTMVNDDTVYSNPYALSFDGDDIVNCGIDATYAFGTGTHTLEAWIYVTSHLLSYNYIMALGTDTAGAQSSIFISSTGYIGQSAYSSPIITFAHDIDTGEWHHIAVVHDTGESTLYIDGEFKETKAIALNVTTGKCYLGCHTGEDAKFVGKLDEVRVWNTARTADQIADNMNVKLIGSETGLVGYWRLDEGTGTSTADSSVSGNTGTITGATWVEGEVGLTRDYMTDSTTYVVDLKEKLLRTMFQYNINEMKDYNNIIRYNEFISNNLTIPDYLEDDLDTLTYYDYTLDTVTLSDKTIVDNIYVFFKAYDFSNIVLANVEIDSIEYKASLVSSSNILDYVTKNPNTVMLFMSGDFIYLYLPSYIPVTSSIYLNVYKESA